MRLRFRTPSPPPGRTRTRRRSGAPCRLNRPLWAILIWLSSSLALSRTTLPFPSRRLRLSRTCLATPLLSRPRLARTRRLQLWRKMPRCPPSTAGSTSLRTRPKARLSASLSRPTSPSCLPRVCLPFPRPTWPSAQTASCLLRSAARTTLSSAAFSFPRSLLTLLPTPPTRRAASSPACSSRRS
eukprot:Amastigsp_a174763_94.p3 type:complete len:184 gc:universal Amastigsp_a174763_94:1515-964(-)